MLSTCPQPLPSNMRSPSLQTQEIFIGKFRELVKASEEYAVKLQSRPNLKETNNGRSFIKC
jgi:hypothetical protein